MRDTFLPYLKCITSTNGINKYAFLLIYRYISQMSDCTLLFFFLNNVPKTLLAQKHE